MLVATNIMMGLIIYSSSLGCLLFTILVLSFATESQGRRNPCPNLDSIYQFGDSIADTGNLVREPGIGPTLPAARLPYGETYGRPTGRWSDGLLIIDYFGICICLSMHPAASQSDHLS